MSPCAGLSTTDGALSSIELPAATTPPVGSLVTCLPAPAASLRADTFAVWQARVFSPPELRDPAISGENALAPNGSGLANLLHYAFALDPHQPVAAGALPALGTLRGFDSLTGLPATYPTLTWQSSSENPPTDLFYVPEITSDLVHGSWRRGPQVFSAPSLRYPTQPGNPILNATQGYLPLGGNPGGLFLRLQVLRGHALPEDWQRANFGRLGVDPEADADGDGRTNWWEFYTGTDPADFYDGELPWLALLGGGDQRGDSGAALPVPISVTVNTANGEGVNAPVTFRVTGGGARLSPSGDPAAAPPTTSVSVRATGSWPDNQGYPRPVAQVYVYLPAAANDASVITASVATGGRTATLATTAVTADPALPPPAGFSAIPTSATTAQLVWTAGDPTRATVVQASLDGGATWHTFCTVAPGVRTINASGLTPDAAVSFRLFTAPGSAGTPPDAGGDGATVSLTLPPSLPASSAGGGGSAGTASASVKPLKRPLMRQELRKGYPEAASGSPGILQTGEGDTHYLQHNWSYRMIYKSFNPADGSDKKLSYTLTLDPATGGFTQTCSDSNQLLNLPSPPWFIQNPNDLFAPFDASNCVRTDSVSNTNSSHTLRYDLPAPADTTGIHVTQEITDELSQPFTASGRKAGPFSTPIP